MPAHDDAQIAIARRLVHHLIFRLALVLDASSSCQLHVGHLFPFRKRVQLVLIQPERLAKAFHLNALAEMVASLAVLGIAHLSAFLPDVVSPENAIH